MPITPSPLTPLGQWICDVCGQIIEDPDHGYVQFNTDANGKYNDFIIVHHATHSPLRDTGGDCYKYRLDTDLPSYLGAEGIARLLSKIDLGHHIEPDFQGANTSNLRAWVDFFRRLHTPYYEEARLYWAKAREDGFFAGANEVWPYLPDILEDLINRYRED